MSETLVARRLLFVDEFGYKIRVFLIDKRGDEWADGWEVLVDYPELLRLIGRVTKEHLEQAFLRWPEPLKKDIKYDAKAARSRWPTALLECALWGDCAMQGEVCWEPGKNRCEIYEPGKREPENVRWKLQDLYNHLRDGYAVAIVEQE
jgi:hypothetical protein